MSTLSVGADAPDHARRAGKPALVFGIVTALGAVAVVIATAVFAICDHPYRAVVTLGTGMVILGVLRAAWPGHPWFSARRRWSDAMIYVAAGAVILWLAPWTAQLPPS